MEKAPSENIEKIPDESKPIEKKTKPAKIYPDMNTYLQEQMDQAIETLKMSSFIIVKQKLLPGNVKVNSESSIEYEVLDQNDKALMIIEEKTDCCAKCCMRATNPLHDVRFMKVDKSRTFMHMKRGCVTYCCLCGVIMSNNCELFYEGSKEKTAGATIKQK
ncbi:MAG: hypothetical protein MHPSP_001845 [Paramarteilia canceri]